MALQAYVAAEHRALNAALLAVLRNLRRDFVAVVLHRLRRNLRLLPGGVRWSDSLNVLSARWLRDATEAFAPDVQTMLLRRVALARTTSLAQLEDALAVLARRFDAPIAASAAPTSAWLVALPVARAMELVAQQVELAFARAARTRAPVPVLLEDVAVRVREHAWRVDRILRTAFVWEYNAVRVAAAVQLQVRSVELRWTELVDDATGEPLDSRVGKDSLAMHGQLSMPGADVRFICPPAPDVSVQLQLQTWAHPPNRPNDRAVLVPWVPDSGVPAWRWVAGTKVVVGQVA